MCKMLDVKDVMEILGVSETKAYAYIRQMNAELAKDGFLTIRDKVPRSYVEKRFFGVSDHQNEAVQDAKP